MRLEHDRDPSNRPGSAARTGGLLLVLLAIACAAGAEDGTAVPFDSPRWKLDAKEVRVETYLGRPSLYVHGGGAVLDDVELADGEIRFDMAFGPQRGFSGAFWHFVSEGNYEEFYLRPHQVDRLDSFQYTPVFHGIAGWQLYSGPGYSGQVSFPFDQWIPVRIAFSGGQGEVYVGDRDEPVLFMHELKMAPGPGKVGVYASSFAPAHFSNFRYRAERPTLRGHAAELPAAPEGMVGAWQISSAFDEARLDGRFAVGATEISDLTWTTMQSERGGFVNIARLQGNEKNTAFARLTITSERARDIAMSFGYSDKVRVYLNGRLLYAGDNTYQSRDFRYLGTIGLFDDVPLSLGKGRNDVLLAVTEGFGGWGVMARFPDASGIRSEP